MIYVDDFKMSGPVEAMKKMWVELRKTIDIEQEPEVGHFLGCRHSIREVTLPNGNKARMMTYDTSDFLKSCVERYEELAKGIMPGQLKTVSTPFVAEDTKRANARTPSNLNKIHEQEGCEDPGMEIPAKSEVRWKCPWCRYCGQESSSKMEEQIKPKKAKARANQKGEQKYTPDHDDIEYAKEVEKAKEEAAMHTSNSIDDNTPGKMKGIAARVLMKVLYGARIARPDLLRAVCALSRHIMKWSVHWDQKLHRIMSYISSTLDLKQFGWVGDSSDELEPHVYADADLAGCEDTLKATSGVCVIIRGPNTVYPIAMGSKGQSCQSLSTPEAEIMAAAYALKQYGIPASMLWGEYLLKRDDMSEPLTVLHEDNQSMTKVMKTGKNPTMRYMSRTHGLNIAWMSTVFDQDYMELVYEKTDRMAADIFTKAFSGAEPWRKACALISVATETELQDVMRAEATEEGEE